MGEGRRERYVKGELIMKGVGRSERRKIKGEKWGRKKEKREKVEEEGKRRLKRNGGKRVMDREILKER